MDRLSRCVSAALSIKLNVPSSSFSIDLFYSTSIWHTNLRGYLRFYRLPLLYLVNLRQRRHRLDEAKVAVLDLLRDVVALYALATKGKSYDIVLSGLSFLFEFMNKSWSRICFKSVVSKYLLCFTCRPPAVCNSRGVEGKY